MIDVKHLSKSFGEVEVLKDITKLSTRAKRSLSLVRQAQENPPFSAVLTLWKSRPQEIFSSRARTSLRRTSMK